MSTKALCLVRIVEKFARFWLIVNTSSVREQGSDKPQRIFLEK
jgi:hypothetical protein